jgi:MFS family permease
MCLQRCCHDACVASSLNLPVNVLLAAGNLVGLLLSPLILTHFGWRALFYLFGLAGGPLLLLWAAVVPSQKALLASSRAAAAGGGASSDVGVGKLMSKSATWAIIIANFGEKAC